MKHIGIAILVVLLAECNSDNIEQNTGRRQTYVFSEFILKPLHSHLYETKTSRQKVSRSIINHKCGG